MTAHDVIAVLRRLLNTRKIGHAGTLDPAASGVLPVAVGTSTRLLSFLRHDKAYRAELTFGQTTSTLDAQGELLQSVSMSFTQKDLLQVLPRFTGAIQQRAPMASAVQVQGRRLYSLARAGIEIERPIRNVEIYGLDLVQFVPEDYPRATVDIRCSGGTYIRSLAEDLGESLGGVAYLSFLLRTDACGLPIETSQTLAEIEESPSWISPNDALAHLPAFQMDEEQAKRFQHGQALENPGLLGTVRMVYDGNLKGISETVEGLLKPKIVIPEES